MTDFDNNELEIGDNVVFALNKFKTTKLQFGIIKKVDVKQANMTMAVIEYNNTTSRVAGWNIYKIKETK